MKVRIIKIPDRARNAAHWHAEGGDIETIQDMEQYNTHGGYYAPKNLVRINTGGTHEQNPNGGVQYGMDNQGIPNLVEEGENIYSKGGSIEGDYVFSNRLRPTKTELKDAGLPVAFAGLTFSAIADKLSEEARERPNDAVSSNGMGAMLDRLQACQEYHKQKQEEAKMRRELSKMSPEELMALGAQMQQQQPMVPQEQIMPMQQAQPMVAAPMMPQDGMMQAPQESMPVMAAYGGLLHPYGCGGKVRILEDGTPGTVVEDPVIAAANSDNSPFITGVYDTSYNPYGEITTPSYVSPEGQRALKWNRNFDKVMDVWQTAGDISLAYLKGMVDDGPSAFLAAGPTAAKIVETERTVARGTRAATRGANKAKKAKNAQTAKTLSEGTKASLEGIITSESDEINKLVEQATKLNNEGKYEEALPIWRNIKEKMSTMKGHQKAHHMAEVDAARKNPRGYSYDASTSTAVQSASTTAQPAEAASAATQAAEKKGVGPWFKAHKKGLIGTGIGAGLLTGVGLGIRAGVKTWGGNGEVSKEPVDAQFGPITNGSGGAYMDGYVDAYGGPIVRKYEGKKGSHLNTGPVTVALMNPPDYDEWYSSYSTEPMYNSGDYTWARYPSGNTGALPAGSGTSLYTTTSTGSTATTGTTQLPVYYQPVQAGFYNLGINGIPNYSITSLSDFVEPIPVEERQAAVTVPDATSGTPNGRIQRAPQSVAGGTPRVEQAPAVVVNTPTGPQLVSEANEAIARWANDDARAIEAGLDTQFADALKVDTTPVGIEKGDPLKVTLPNASTKKSSASAQLPVIGRYAEAVDATGKLALNALRGQDYLQAPRIRPTFIDGRLALHDMRYTPTDRQAMYNALSGQVNGLYRNLADVTPALSLPAAMLAAGHSAGIETGNAVAQGNLANNQLLQQVIGVHNNNEATESNFYKGINAANAQIANQTAQRQAYLDSQYDMLNDQNQTALWQAQSALSEKAARAVAAKATENFHMNQVNSNRALLGYWVDALGWAHYTTPDGSQVVYDTKTGNIISQTKPTVRPKGFISPEKQKEIQEDIDARIAKMRQKHGLPTK